ncbi:uncharacterized protein Dwil_GK20688 [Drosophila willistoni]|uniref:V-type proton ATPase subunit a n=1 Tax=Drosophila willistoni TaxID=7260 RepID=B4MK34_DROWI|nr:V-type proton ATPase 116 kDa subunit a1 [Drosophila willistoni]EDW72473.2 uncharacterized protein Dwil_GK20688 [Drosophila willistoni]
MAKAFFRSEKMELCQLLLHMENAFNVMVEVGHHGGIQFNNVYDEDRVMNGIYTKKVMLCQELMRIVDYLQDQLKLMEIDRVFYPEVDRDNRPCEKDIKDYDERLRRMNIEVAAVMENFQSLIRRRASITEQKFAIEKADKFFSSERGQIAAPLYSESVIMNLLKDTAEAEPSSEHLNYIIGCIRADQFHNFELLLYRFFGFNLMVRYSELPKPMKEYHGSKAQEVRKFALLMITTSIQIRTKLIKVCQAYHVTIYECPETPRQRQLLIMDLNQEVRDLDLILRKSFEMRKNILDLTAVDLYVMRINLRKSRKIYDLLNRLRLVGGTENRNYLQCECFVPESEIDGIRTALKRGSRLSGGADGDAPSKRDNEFAPNPPILVKRTRKFKHMPPTYFRLNKFTKGFQNLIDAYGMGDYRELNPAPYTIITFPFLFGVMFGDIGHGILMSLFATALIWKEKSIERKRRTDPSEDEIMNILFAGRYIILLMGLFSIYIGFIYNDVLSKSVNIFGSSWSCRYNATTLNDMRNELMMNPSDNKFFTGDPYILGMDPIWHICGEDSITTFNSLKMKMAIILGIGQMMFGLSLAAVNCILLKRKPDLFLVVIPQFVFMTCIFCYLVFLIFLKWLVYGGLKQHPHTAGCAPSVLITFIDMMLLKTSEPLDESCDNGMFPGERIVEYVLVAVAFLAVPVLLAGKPIYLTRRQKQLHKERDIKDLQQKGRDTILDMRSSLRYSIDYQDDLTNSSTNKNPKPETVDDAVEFDMSEIWIHSGIHTIESVLGSVSHTASYLRLWALSLAHDQLSDVLWHMILHKGLHNKLPIYLGAPVLAFVFFFWAILTIAILVMMEGLSAFLHTLRLHWVEFQSKFFNGAGEPFVPFHFQPSTIRD